MLDTTTMIARAFDIADSEYPPQGNNENPDREDARWYSMLRALIIDAFNPPDDDVAECSLLADAVVHVFQFIESAPCTCKVSDDQVHVGDWVDYDVCPRCEVLGRCNDVSIER